MSERELKVMPVGPGPRRGSEEARENQLVGNILADEDEHKDGIGSIGSTIIRPTSAPPQLAIMGAARRPGPTATRDGHYIIKGEVVSPNDPRLTPEYYDYYYNQRPIDPRLPPPLFDWSCWHHENSQIQGLRTANPHALDKLPCSGATPSSLSSSTLSAENISQPPVISSPVQVDFGISSRAQSQKQQDRQSTTVPGTISTDYMLAEQRETSLQPGTRPKVDEKVVGDGKEKTDHDHQAGTNTSEEVKANDQTTTMKPNEVTRQESNPSLAALSQQQRQKLEQATPFTQPVRTEQLQQYHAAISGLRLGTPVMNQSYHTSPLAKPQQVDVVNGLANLSLNQYAASKTRLSPTFTAMTNRGLANLNMGLNAGVLDSAMASSVNPNLLASAASISNAVPIAAMGTLGIDPSQGVVGLLPGLNFPGSNQHHRSMLTGYQVVNENIPPAAISPMIAVMGYPTMISPTNLTNMVRYYVPTSIRTS